MVRAERAASWLVAAMLAICLASAVMTIDKGLALNDESSNIYLLLHPRTDAQFLDYRLWAPLGGTVIFFRAFAVAAMAASILPAAVGAWRLLRERLDPAIRPGPALPAMATAIGALGILSTGRFTMNYSFSAAVASNLIAGILVCGLGRATARGALLAGAAIGPCVALLLVSRFPAVALAAILVAAGAATHWWLGARRVAVTLAAAAVASGVACGIALGALGFDVATMLEIAPIGRSSSEFGAVIRADAVRFAAILAFGAGCAAPVIVAEHVLRRAWSPSALARYSAGMVLLCVAGQALHQIVRLARMGASTLAFNGNIAIYSVTYGYFAILAYLLVLLVFLRGGTQGRRDNIVLYAGLLILVCGLLLPYAGTNTGIMPRAAENSGMILIVLLLPLGLTAFRHARPALFPVAAVAITAFTTATIVYNAVLVPWGNTGSIFALTGRLATPASLAGVEVSPELAGFQRRMLARFAEDDFDRAEDAMLPPQGLAGFVLLAGARLAGPPYMASQEAGGPIYYCDGIARAIADRPRRIFVFNPQALARPIVACLAAQGYPLAGAALRPIDGRFGYAVAVDRRGR